MKKNIIRLVVEVGFIMILFYSNLVMGDFVQSGEGYKRGFIWAVESVFTTANLVIALVAGCAAYIVVEYLRKSYLRD